MADPIRLSELVSRVVSRVAAFKQPDQGVDAEAITQALDDLDDLIQDVRQQAARLRDPKKREAALLEIERLLGVEDVPLDLFFSEVGRAVMTAQRALDKQSEEDLSPDAASVVTPVLYSIPTVHAEMKVGFSQVSSRGINLLVFNNQEQKQHFSESTISFDIVAAPVPPNHARMGEAAGPGRRAASGPAPVSTAGPPLEGGAATSFALEGGPATDQISDDGAARETPAEPPTRPRGRPRRHIVRTPTLPLREEARDPAIDLLDAELGAAHRTHLRSVREQIVVVPLQPIARVETLLYLCPGAGGKAAAARRAFRCYLGDRTQDGPLSLRRPHRPNHRPSADDGYAGEGLLVPAAPAGRAARFAIPAVAGGVGAVLMHIVRAVTEFRPPWTLDPIEDHDLIARVDRKLPPSVPPLTASHGEWATLVDHGDRGPQFRQWVVMRPVFADRTLEWSEIHVVGVPQQGRARTRWPHVHIPDDATLEHWRSTSSKKLTSLGDSFEPLLRRLTSLVDDVSR